MEKVLSFQYSFFGNFTSLNPSLDLMNLILSKLLDKQWLPSAIQVNTFNPIKKEINIQTRNNIMSLNQAWKIFIFNERIDINYEFVDEKEVYSKIEDVILKTNSVSNVLGQVLDNIVGTRLAINGKFIIRKSNSYDKQKVIKKFAIIPNYYDENNISEWRVNFNSQEKNNFGKFNDIICNNISEVYDINYGRRIDSPSMSGLVLSIDINTDQTNKIPQFKYIDILEFSQIVIPKILIEINEVERKINDN